MKKIVVLASLALLFGIGCTTQVDAPTSTDPVSVDESALKGGCHTNCPKCKPGEMCPMIACLLVCPGDKCGTSVCQKGEYCCNESCGICAPEGGFCTTQVCTPQ